MMDGVMSGWVRFAHSVACAGIALVVALTAARTTQAQTPLVPPGAGTAASPYLISQLGHLVWMGENVGSSNSRHYTLQNDIDASDTANWYGGAGFAPIGTNVTPFIGIFDGNGKVISGLTINRPSQELVGFFGYVGTGGVVKNLGLAGGSVTGKNQVGGLVGENAGTVSECYATGAVTGISEGDYEYAGGLVGVNDGTVIRCYATGAVTGDTIDWWSFAGGLIGGNAGTVSECHATGAVLALGGGEAGGLVGENTGTVSECYATGAVTAICDQGGAVAGGLIGNNIGPVSRCYATGAVMVPPNPYNFNGAAGGLIGDNNGTISGCYATGAVTSGAATGGLVGHNQDGTVSECYATGAVSGAATGGLVGGLFLGTVDRCYATGAVTGGVYAGGLVGDAGPYAAVTNSYWDRETSGQDASDGGAGKTTWEMKQQVTFVDWDFTTVWLITEGVTYPSLWSFHSPVLDWICDKTVAEGTYLAFTLTATDPDGDTLTYSSTALPAGATLNAITGAFSWTPGLDQSGSYNITFTVTDNGTPNLDDSETITITVNNVTVHDPVLFTDDFSNGSAAGDPEWKKNSGIWKVDAKKRYQAASASATSLSTVKTTVLPAQTAVRIESLVMFATPGAVPNAMVVFGLQGIGKYRYVQLVRNEIRLGQVGAFGGNVTKVHARKTTALTAGRMYTVRVDVYSNGTVKVYLGTVLKLTYKFKQPMPGVVGVGAVKSNAYFDNFRVKDATVLP